MFTLSLGGGFGFLFYPAKLASPCVLVFVSTWTLFELISQWQKYVTDKLIWSPLLQCTRLQTQPCRGSCQGASQNWGTAWGQGLAVNIGAKFLSVHVYFHFFLLPSFLRVPKLS